MRQGTLSPSGAQEGCQGPTGYVMGMSTSCCPQSYPSLGGFILPSCGATPRSARKQMQLWGAQREQGVAYPTQGCPGISREEGPCQGDVAQPRPVGLSKARAAVECKSWTRGTTYRAGTLKARAAASPQTQIGMFPGRTDWEGGVCHALFFMH